MEKGFRLSQEQKLQQRLTPLQVRYVRMLEMSGPEFEDEIRNAVDEMPALEASSPEMPGPEADEAAATEDGSRFSESASEMQIADYRSEDDIPDYLARGMYGRSQGTADSGFQEPVAAAGAESLFDNLTRQLDELEISPDERVIARYIIGNLDDNGYLTRDIPSLADDIAVAEGRDFPSDLIREVWRKVRTLDPPGVGAVDLRDCLLLQLRRLPRSVETLSASEIIRDYFDLFAKKHFSRIATSMGIDEDRLRAALAVIGRLNPKPGGLLETPGGTAQAVIPDFMVEADPEGNLSLTLLNHVPELSIERSFAADTPLPEASPRAANAARMFLKQKRDEASDFIKLVGMRQQTLFTVMSAILKCQREFFLTEDEARIKPMVLRELAAMTGLDLSVVSRATQGKYVMTPHGVYPLKMFFNERLRKDAPPGEETDNTTPRIMAAMKSIIEREDKSHPLSDEQITRRLTADGFDIARRTVAKYREKLGFPVGRLRKSL